MVSRSNIEHGAMKERFLYLGAEERAVKACPLKPCHSMHKFILSFAALIRLSHCSIFLLFFDTHHSKGLDGFPHKHKLSHSVVYFGVCTGSSKAGLVSPPRKSFFQISLKRAGKHNMV